MKISPKTPQSQKEPFDRISMTITKDLLKKIDQHAVTEKRSRSNWIVTKLEAIILEIEDESIGRHHK